MIPELILLALDFYRAPLRFSHLTDPNRPLPVGFEKLVGAFAGALLPRNIEATAASLGTHPDDLEEASRFFLRQVLLSPRSNHYRVLGLSPKASEETIRQHYQLLVGIFHPDRSTGDAESDAIAMARINEAYNVLKSPVSRQRYDHDLVFDAERPAIDMIRTAPFRPTRVVRSGFFFDNLGKGFRGCSRKRSGLLVLGGGAAAFAATVAILHFDRQPLLRANPDLVEESVTYPSFLSKPPKERIQYSTSRGERPARGDEVAFGKDPGASQITSSENAIPIGARSLMQREEPYPLEQERIRDEASGRIPPQNSSDSDTSGPTKGPEALRVAGVKHSEPIAKVPPQKAARPVKSATSDAMPPDSANQGAKNPLTPQKGGKEARTSKENAVAARGPHTEEGTTAVRPESVSTVRSHPRTRPEDLIARLIRCYQAGNLSGFVNLFTADARVNDGDGQEFIRADYARFFTKAPERWLSIGNLRWQLTENGKLRGSGTYRVRIKDSPNANWRYSSGELLIELVPWMSSYRISKMIHR